MKNSLKKGCLLFRKMCILAIVTSIYSACDNTTVYNKSKSLPEGGWKQQDTVYFATLLKDSLHTYKVTLEIRNNSNYSYTNLPLLFEMRTPPNKDNLKDSIIIKLANSKGEWLGKGWGGLYQSEYTVGRIQANSPGIYLFKLIYLLPDKSLKGINDIGLKLER